MIFIVLNSSHASHEKLKAELEKKTKGTVFRRCSAKWMLEIVRNPKENTCAGTSF